MWKKSATYKCDGIVKNLKKFHRGFIDDESPFHQGFIVLSGRVSSWFHRKTEKSINLLRSGEYHQFS